MNTSAVSFVPSRYEPGVSTRADIACNLFKIVAHGRMGYEEENPMAGMFYLDGSVSVTRIADITSAVLIAEYLHTNKAWEYRDPNFDYYCELLGRDGGPLSFSFQYLEILDRHGKRVMSASSGYKKPGLQWDACIVSEARKALALDEMKALAQRASEERRGDNYDSARWLDTKYEQILSRFVTSRYNRQAIINELEQASAMQPQALINTLSLALAKSSLTSEALPF